MTRGGAMSGSSSSPGCSPVPLNWEMSSSSGISMDTSVIGISGKGSPQQLPEALPLKKNFGNLHRILALLCNQQLFRESNLRDPSVIKIICGRESGDLDSSPRSITNEVWARKRASNLCDRMTLYILWVSTYLGNEVKTSGS